jgi:hypothetical protein
MKRRLLVAVGLLVVAGIGLYFARTRYADYRAVASLDNVLPAPTYRAARTHFPFSVVPGGVLNAAELTDSIRRDPVVRDHYQDLNPTRLVPARMPRAATAYVSFRKNDKVYWTRDKVHIPAGELVLSDGLNYVRARCGNRVKFYPSPEATAEKRRTPIPPVEDPPFDVMEAGMPGLLQPRVLPPIVPTTVATANTPVPPEPPGVYWPPVVPPPVWCCSKDPEPPPPVVPGVPEPSTFIMVAAGAAALASRFRRK